MSQPPVEFAVFYDREYARVLGTLTLYLGDRTVAEDLAQESFVRVCEHWERVEVMDAPGAWVHRVAMNLANSRLRHRGSERRATHRLTNEHIDTFAETADAVAVRGALAKLAKPERAVLVLRYYAGLSVAETAQVLNRPEGTVKTWTRRALARLRRSGLVEDVVPHA